MRMGRRSFALAAAIAAAASTAMAGGSVSTWHNDASRTGANVAEWTLSPANVNVATFGLIGFLPTDGAVDAQPLVSSGVPYVSGTAPDTRDYLLIATEHDSVYAFDGADQSLLWQTSLLQPGETPADNFGCSELGPEVGIMATPLGGAGLPPLNRLKLVATSKDAQSNYHHRLHDIDGLNGSHYGTPIEITAIFPGNGDGANGGTIVFDPRQYIERAGLVSDGYGTVYTSWSSHCGARPYNGWLIGYDQNGNQRVLNLAPNGYGASVWQSGAAPPSDGTFVYAVTGDGTFDTTLDANGFPAQRDFGNSLVQIRAGGGGPFDVADYFTMFNTTQESAANQDFGSGGALLVPDLLWDSTGQGRRLIVAAGEDQHIYIADRYSSTLGKYSAGNANLYQDVVGALNGPVFSSPAYFNGHLYYGAAGDALKAFQFVNAHLDPVPTSSSAITFQFPGTTPSISAFAKRDGIVWAVEQGAMATLHAYDANDLSRELYNSNQEPNGRDNFGAASKFVVPTIANGKVYVATPKGVAVFGLLNPPHLANMSTRGTIGSSENVLIGGFIVSGETQRRVLIRAVGPSMSVNGTPVAGRINDPSLHVYGNGNATDVSNDNWQDSAQRDEIAATGLAPADPKEPAVIVTLRPGNYTAVVSGASGDTGIGLVEMYDLSNDPKSRIGNLSTRGYVGTGDNVLIGGVIFGGGSSSNVLFRAIGAGLQNQGVQNYLGDPMLDVYDSNGVAVASNDNVYDGGDTERIFSIGFPPMERTDSALIAALKPGGYTAIVRGARGNTGVALVEAYALR